MAQTLGEPLGVDTLAEAAEHELVGLPMGGLDDG
jgi:hypothetical protein